MNKDKIVNIIFWISMPTLVATYEHPEKWVRTLGLVGVFVFFPLSLTFYPMILPFAVFCLFNEN